jgi:SSS family solute:Na+ symporter
VSLWQKEIVAELIMNYLDWSIIIAYIAGMVLLSYYLGRKQKNPRDYYLGGNKMRWLPLGLSTMATQCSTNSLIGAPAFVGFVAGGGLLWLQYELAVPIAMIIIMAFLIPFYRRCKVISVYEYLEHRFGPGTRTLLSIIFQLFRAFATGVTVYGISILLQKVFGIPFFTAVIILGVVTIIYDSLGGMEAVVYSDVIQMVILVSGIIITLAFALHLAGGIDNAWGLFEAKRHTAIDFTSWGFADGKNFGFWPMLIGGLFLYCSYYGCDQSQVQREISARNADETNLSLAFNGFGRFPLVLLYCFLGVAIAAYAASDQSFLIHLKDSETGNINYNWVVPVFVLHHLPHGIIGIIMVALFAAAMSSLDSTINSLSATSMQDVVQRFFLKDITEKTKFIYGKVLTVFWGVLCCVFSFAVGNISDSVIEAINKIGSLANGPILATFVLGIFTRRASGKGTVVGILSGYAINTFFWIMVPQVSWLWWNVIGFLGTFLVGYFLSLLWPERKKDISSLVYNRKMPVGDYKRNWKPVYVALGIYALLLVVFLTIF